MEKIRESSESVKKSLGKGPEAIGNYEELDMVRVVYPGKKFTWHQKEKLSREKENYSWTFFWCQGKELGLDYQEASISQER